MNVFPSYREPLTPTAKRALALLVVLFHVGVGWVLVTTSPHKLVVGDVAAMEVRMVRADAALQADPVVESAADPPPEFPRPLELEVPKEPEMPVFPPPPELATVVEPPPPNLPPPVFPIEAPPPKPPGQKAVTPSPSTPPPRPPERPKVAVPSRPALAHPHAAPEAPARPAPSSAPKTVSASQVTYIKPPSTEYPARSRRAGEQGRVRLLVLVDTAGRPAQVNLQTSSGFPALDEAATSAVRSALFRPYSEGGVAQAVWVVVPIEFVLR
ncbi:MAG: energy transducer TonB [Reyranella sp.]|uniref:energy transducer TonB n=1 Tax=Reyranella sp. TaxID=1929291 RepID=UPI003D0F484B